MITMLLSKAVIVVTKLIIPPKQFFPSAAFLLFLVVFLTKLEFSVAPQVPGILVPPINGTNATEVAECEDFKKQYRDPASRSLSFDKLRNLRKKVTRCLWKQVTGRLGRNVHPEETVALLQLAQPPPVGQDGFVHVNITDIKLRKISLQEGSQDGREVVDLNSRLVFNVSWYDKRLEFNATDFNRTEFYIFGQLEADIWHPQLGRPLKGKDNQWQLIHIENTTFRPDGFTIATNGISLLRTKCRYHLESYPNDNFTCTSNIQIQNDPHLIKLHVPNPEGQIIMPFLYGEKFKTYSKISLSVEQGDIGERLKMTLSVAHDDPMLRSQFQTLVATCVIVCLVAMLSPLGVCDQFTLKLFALLYQFLCFKSLMGQMQFHLGGWRYAVGTNKYCLFYQFSIAITCISLMITGLCQLISGGLSHVLSSSALIRTLMGKVFKIAFLGNVIKGPALELEEGDLQWDPPVKFAYWVLSVICIIVYLLGIIIVLA